LGLITGTSKEEEEEEDHKGSEQETRSTLHREWNNGKDNSVTST
jgi:hypothetical protein